MEKQLMIKKLKGSKALINMCYKWQLQVALEHNNHKEAD